MDGGCLSAERQLMLSIAIRERVVLLDPNSGDAASQTVQSGCDIMPTWLIPSCIHKNTQGHEFFFSMSRSF